MPKNTGVGSLSLLVDKTTLISEENKIWVEISVLLSTHSKKKGGLLCGFKTQLNHGPRM